MSNRTTIIIVAVVIVLAIAWFGGFLGGTAPEAPLTPPATSTTP